MGKNRVHTKQKVRKFDFSVKQYENEKKIVAKAAPQTK